MDTDPQLDPRLAEAVSRLRDSEPLVDLWPGIARQIEPRSKRETPTIRWPTALAAGVVLAIATSGATAFLLRRTGYQPAPVPSVARGPSADSNAAAIPASYASGDAALAKAVDDLERAVKTSMIHLDPEAQASVNKSLAALDQAIAQAAARQSAAPDDPRAAKYLTTTLRKKLQLLRTVSELTQQQGGRSS